MLLEQVDPVMLRIPRELVDRARPLLQAKDTSAEYELRRLRQNAGWKRHRMGPAAYDAEVKALEARVNLDLLYVDGDGHWTLSGLREHLSSRLGVPYEVLYDLPEPRGLPWLKSPEELLGKPPMPHQLLGASRAIQAGHGTCDFACGAGKTLTFVLFLRELGLRSAVVVYSKVLAEQITAALVRFFGERFVGEYNGSTKQLGKLITVCTGGTLRNVKRGSEAWGWFSSCKILIGDESHLFGADVLCEVATNLFAAAPYRLFTSATQTRGDGRELLLRGVVGPTLAELTFRQAVELDLLAKPTFCEVPFDSSIVCQSGDPDRLTRAHVYESPQVADMAAALADKLEADGYSVLILAEEFPQLALISQRLRGDFAVLHGNTGEATFTVNFWQGASERCTASARLEVRERGTSTWLKLAAEDLHDLLRERSGVQYELRSMQEDPKVPGSLVEVVRHLAGLEPRTVTGRYLLDRKFRECDSQKIVADFNAQTVRKVLMSGAGRVGVDFRPCRPMALLYLVGGTSEIAFVQAIGRGSRRQGKDHFLVVDFRPRNIPRLDIQADTRNRIMTDLWESPTSVELGLLLGT